MPNLGANGELTTTENVSTACSHCFDMISDSGLGGSTIDNSMRSYWISPVQAFNIFLLPGHAGAARTCEWILRNDLIALKTM